MLCRHGLQPETDTLSSPNQHILYNLLTGSMFHYAIAQCNIFKAFSLSIPYSPIVEFFLSCTLTTWVRLHVLYVRVCMFVCMSTAVCFFPQSAFAVAFMALNAGSPPPVACDIGSWHPRVYSECRRTHSPPEMFVLSKRGGVCPSKPLGKLSTALVKRLQTTLKTQSCPQQMFVLRRLCSVALGA